jgi:hypothetical protein
MKRLSMDSTNYSVSFHGLSVLLAALALPFVLMGCEKEEPPPPLPAAPPAATPAPATELKIEEEALPEPTAAPAVKGTGTGKPAQSLKNCCAALRQNAASAPEPNKGYMLTAAGICDGMVAAGNTQGASAALQAALRGANLPSSCY